MIIWSGHGILIVLFALLGAIAGSFAGGGVARMIHPEAAPDVSVLGAIIFATAGVWLYALTIGRTTSKTLLDPATGRPVVLHKRHSLFFIPAFGWAIISTGFALIAGAGGVMSIINGPVPGKSALEGAESHLGRSSGPAAAGNTKEAQTMATSFSAMLAGIRNVTIENNTSASSNVATGAGFRTFCQMGDHGTAFIVNVPDLRKFSDEAKKSIMESAWITSRMIAEKMNPPPKKLAVAVRGRILYEGAFVGTCSGDFTQNPRAGVESEYKSSEAGDALTIFFAANSPSPALTPPAP